VEAFDTANGEPGVRWLGRDLKPPIFQQAAELFARGMSVREVKQALGISHGEAGRLRHRAAAEGLLEAGREAEREEVEGAADEPFRLN
jgi:transposase-like protein